MSGLRLGLEFRVRVIGARWRLGFRVMLKLGLCMRAADVRDGDFRKGDVYPGGGANVLHALSTRQLGTDKNSRRVGRNRTLPVDDAACSIIQVSCDSSRRLAETDGSNTA